MPKAIKWQREIEIETENLNTKAKCDTADPLPIELFPFEMLNHLTSFLDKKNLGRLRRVNHLFKEVVDSHYQVYSKLYKRLLAIEPSLSPELPEAHFLKAYHEALEKVEAIQQDEIQFLTENHTALPENTIAIQDENLTPLERFEQQSQKLDQVNSNIIKEHIDLNSTILDLRDKKITRLPKQLFEANEYENYWKKLVGLDLSCNQIRSLPLAIGNCQALQELVSDLNQLTSLPETLGNCQALQGLYCYNNQLTSLPASLGNCQALQRLDCNLNQLTSIPATLGNCQALQSLVCDANQLDSLPETLGNCQALKKLVCYDNQLTSLPDALGNCQALQVLDCQFNLLTLLPETLGNCQALQVLSCNANQLFFLPEMLGNCQALQELFCGYNKLTSIPATLSNCQALKKLVCYDNQLTSLPDNLTIKMGAQWAESVLSKQQPIVYSMQALQNPNTLTPAHNSIKRKKYDISAREMQQLDESAMMPPGAKRMRKGSSNFR